MIKIPFTRFGNDLFAEIQCTCTPKQYKDGPLDGIMKTRISLSGYNDDYFFDTVNAKKRMLKCECGKTYIYRWYRDGLWTVDITQSILEADSLIKKAKAELDLIPGFVEWQKDVLRTHKWNGKEGSQIGMLPEKHKPQGESVQGCDATDLSSE